jgi:chromosomal replication initiation ATPase DnaA
MTTTPHEQTLARVREILDPYGIDLEELRSCRRPFRSVEARWAVIRYLREEKGWYNNRIARFINRDHSTVKHAIDKAEAGRRAGSEASCQGLTAGGNHAIEKR